MLEAPQEVSFSIAFMAGFLSFISPCVLPLVPGYVSFVTGLSVEELADPNRSGYIRWVALKNSLLF
ncbi:MAG TPA: cytochrome c biogenesis protein CcdA, partial [Nitrospiria bacterium]|nr:cytochrome c biogenesis protein CcdA [Nitrospiria bacterium]